MPEYSAAPAASECWTQLGSVERVITVEKLHRAARFVTLQRADPSGKPTPSILFGVKGRPFAFGLLHAGSLPKHPVPFVQNSRQTSGVPAAPCHRDQLDGRWPGRAAASAFGFGDAEDVMSCNMVPVDPTVVRAARTRQLGAKEKGQTNACPSIKDLYRSTRRIRSAKQPQVSTVTVAVLVPDTTCAAMYPAASAVVVLRQYGRNGVRLYGCLG